MHYHLENFFSHIRKKLYLKFITLIRYFLLIGIFSSSLRAMEENNNNDTTIQIYSDAQDNQIIDEEYGECLLLLGVLGIKCYLGSQMSW